MRITLTVEVESREALATILRTGAEQSLFDYQVIGFHFSPPLTPVGLSHTTEDYRNAPSEIGPLAAEWADKPHRLVYDLCQEVERLVAGPDNTVGWRAASNGAGARHWFVIHEEKRLYHRNKKGQLVRYASCEAAQRKAAQLNRQRA
jgi:hypothetical protein